MTERDKRQSSKKLEIHNLRETDRNIVHKIMLTFQCVESENLNKIPMFLGKDSRNRSGDLAGNLTGTVCRLLNFC